MSLSGPDALRSLDEALRDIRREEDEIAKRLAHSADLITKMELFGGDSKGLYMLNSELKTRVYTAPSLVL